MFYFLDCLQKLAKQQVQRRQVHDVDETIVVAESLIDLWANVAKVRENWSNNVSPNIDNNRSKGRPSPNRCSDKRGNNCNQPSNFRKNYEDRKKVAPPREGSYILGKTTHVAHYCPSSSKLCDMVAVET